MGVFVPKRRALGFVGVWRVSETPVKAVDRRVGRTKLALHQALIELIREQRYDSISVSAITERANVGRSTFYAHYADKDDLFADGFAHLREMLLELTADRPNEPLAFSLPMLQHAIEFRDLFRALVDRRSGAAVTELMHATLSEVVRRRLPPDPDLEIQVQLIVGAFQSLMTWWLSSQSDLSAQVIDARFRAFVEQSAAPDAPG